MQNFKFCYNKYFVLLLTLTFFCQCQPEEKAATNNDEPLTVISRLRAEPDRLIPLLTVRGWSLQVANTIYPTLLEYDPHTHKLAPKLAKSLPKVEPITEGEYAGGVAYTFEILDEATWDNGQPVLASDYVFALKALFNPKLTTGAGVYRLYLDMIKDVEIDASNPKKFTVYTDRTYIRSEYGCGFYAFPEYAFDSKGLLKDFKLKDLTNPEKAKALAESDPRLEQFAKEFSDPAFSNDPKNIISCGAYNVEEWLPKERIVLTKKKNWWGEKVVDTNPQLTAGPDYLIFKPIPDATTALSLLMDEKLDVINFVPNSQFVELKKNENVTKNYDFYTPNTPVYNFFGLNNRNPKLNDKRVRKALAHLTNAEEMIKTVKYGMAFPIASPVSPNADYLHKGLKPVALNIEKARTLLDEAGWKDSNGNGVRDKMIDGELVELELNHLITPRNEDSNNMVLIFQETAKKAGVKIVITPKEANLFREDRNKGNFEIYSAGAALDAALYDPYQSWHTKSTYPNGSNYYNFGNAETDALIEEIRGTLDKTKRNELYKKFQEILYEETPVLLLYFAQDRVIVHKRLKNAKPMDTYPSVHEHYFTH